MCGGNQDEGTNMDQKTTNRLKAHVAGVVFAVLVGFSFMSLKICIPIATPLQILSFRYNFAFIAAILLLATGINRVSFRNKPLGKVGLVVFCYVGFMVFQTLGMVFTSSVEGAILFAMVPIFAKIIARFVLGEKSTVLQEIFMWLSISALILMIVMGASALSFSVAGILLLAIASALIAGSNVMMRQIKSVYTPIEITFAIVVSGFLFFNTVTIIHGLTTDTLGEYLSLFGNLKFVIATAYLGIFCILFTSQLMSYMMANMPAVQGTLYGNVSTAISIIAGTIFLSEPLQIYHIVCAALIVAGVVGISLTGDKTRNIALPDRNGIK
jgi:drug/metabolite transporter (DMT)-like permease